MHNFKRDIKGLCFLILIPIIVTLGAVLVVKVGGSCSHWRICPCPARSRLPLCLLQNVLSRADP